VTILVDSDILIEVLRGRDAAILASWAALSESDDVVLCSPVSLAELWHGARAHEHEALTALFSALVCVPVDAETGRRAGVYLRTYHKSHAVELGDALIAATAVQQNALLWTRNQKHYPMKETRFYK
jgi:predicted nucleic acid-binding protein